MRLGPESDGLERLAVYRAVRDSGLLPDDALATTLRACASPSSPDSISARSSTSLMRSSRSLPALWIVLANST